MNREKSAKNHQRSATGETASGFGKAVKSSLSGVLSALVAGIVLIFIAAAVCYASSDPDTFTSPLSLAALYLSAIIAGLISVRKNGGSALLCGILAGIFLTVFYVFISFFFETSDNITSSLPASLGLRALITVFSIFGAFLGLNLKKSGKKRRQRR